MPPIKPAVLAAALLAASAVPASALVVFESEGWGQTPTQYPGSVGIGEYSAGRFTLAGTTQISTAAWVGAYISDGAPLTPDPSPDFHIAFFEMSGDTVGAEIWSAAVDPVAGPGAVAEQRVDFAPQTLAAGDYLFAVANRTTNGYYLLGVSSSSSNLVYGDADADQDLAVASWTNYLDTAPIFQLSNAAETSAVPLPAPVALLGAGLAALGFAARRRG